MSGPSSFGFLSRILTSLWPIKRHETKSVLPMLAIFFLAAFVYQVLRDIKDTLIITAEFSGAEVIPFLKVWAILPAAVICTMIFNKLSNRFHYQTVGLIIIAGFLAFLLSFIFILYPYRESLHLHSFASLLNEILPRGFSGCIMMVRYWSFALFYVASEMWGVMMISLFFWGFVNEVTPYEKAPRLYPLLSLSGNCAGIFSGPLSYHISHNMRTLFIGEDLWQQSLTLLIMACVLCGVLILFLFRHINHLSPIEDKRISAKPKAKMSLKENFACIMKSRKLLYITVIVLCYNITNNLLEVVWKGQIRELHPSPGEYNAYINQVTTWIGIVATALAFMMSGLFKRFRWTFVAMMTPRILLWTSLLFLPLLLLRTLLPMGTMIPLTAVVFIGSLQNVFMRSAKFTLFDSTKEMAFISLSVDERRHGKAAIDGIGSRFGKSGGSLLYQILLMSFGTLSASIPYITGVLLALILPSFLSATKSLGRGIEDDKDKNDATQEATAAVSG